MKRSSRKPAQLTPRVLSFGPGMFEIEIPVMTKSEMNLREHWAAKAKRTKGQREIASLSVATLMPGPVRRAIRLGHLTIVTFTRLGGREMDRDNLAASMKHVQDGVFQAIGLDDGSKRTETRYEQEPDNKTVRGVRVRFVETEPVE